MLSLFLWKAELEMVKARADKASAIAALPPASANSSTSSEGGLENATSATAQAQQASLQAAVSAAEATLARAEHDSRAAAAAFKQAEAAVLAAVIVVPLRASKQEHPRSNRQGNTELHKIFRTLSAFSILVIYLV